MKRREFITLLGGVAVGWPLAAHAQQPAMPVIGILSSSSASESWIQNLSEFREGLGVAGYTEGRNVTIEARWAEGQYDRLPVLAADLTRRRVALIAAFTTPAVAVAKAATTAIPIVFTTIADPVRVGLVTSLNHPGGNVTGVTLLSVQVGPKSLELLHQTVPSATVMALLVNPTNPNAQTQSRNMQAAAGKLGLQLHVINATAERDFDVVFSKLSELRAAALMIVQDPLFNTQAGRLASLSVRHAMPAAYVDSRFAQAGGLLSYGASQRDAYRQVGLYAGRILKGEKPGDLPVMQPTKFELTINLKTAKAIGLTVPPAILASADEVIE